MKYEMDYIATMSMICIVICFVATLIGIPHSREMSNNAMPLFILLLYYAYHKVSAAYDKLLDEYKNLNNSR